MPDRTPEYMQDSAKTHILQNTHFLGHVEGI